MSTILVTGGTGKTGRRIVERLRGANIDVRVGSRSAEIPFDWEDPATWAPALAGVRAVYVSFYPDLAVPGAPQAVEALAAEARRAGVQRIVLLSGRGEAEAQAAEAKVVASGLAYTIVRCSWFMQNFSEHFLRDVVMGGVLALPVGDVGEPFVDCDDIADVAVAALTEDGHAGELYELTGPRLMTFADTAREIAEASGRDVQFVQVSSDEFDAGLAAAGVPDIEREFVVWLFTVVLDGRNESLGDGVQRALGREPRDFAVFADHAAASGAWS